MSRFVIIIAVVLALPLFLIAILMLVLSNPEAYRDQISETIEVSTGYQLMIGGELSWRYWPPIAINVEQVSVSIPGSDKPFATIEGASVELDLLPLITGSAAIGVKGLSVHGLILQPVIDKDGKNNWEINATAASSGSPTPSQENPDPVSEEPSPGLAVNIDAINVTDMRIDYRDESLVMRFTLDIANLSTGSIVYDTAITLDSIEFTNASVEFQDESSGVQFKSGDSLPIS